MLGARSAGLDCRTLKSQDSRQLSAMQTPFSTQSDEKKKKRHRENTEDCWGSLSKSPDNETVFPSCVWVLSWAGTCPCSYKIPADTSRSEALKHGLGRFLNKQQTSKQ